MKRTDLTPGTRVQLVDGSLGTYCRQGTTGTVLAPRAPLTPGFDALVRLDGDPIGPMSFRAAELEPATGITPVPA